MIKFGANQSATVRYFGHEPVDPHAARLLHLSFTPDGAVVAQRKGQLLVLLEGTWQRAAKVRECMGWIWKRLPGMKPPHQIVASLADGFPVSVAVAEMVFNDAGLVDSICGEGTYEKLMAARRESEALMIARRLYAQPELVVVGGRGNGKGARSAA